MVSHAKCCFCDIVNGKYKYSGIDQPFMNSDSFIAIASIGAFIEGWSLIIPKEHQLSMRNIYNKSEFIDFTKEVISLLVDKYGHLIAFEHGSNKEGSITACGTNHAHLHIVPFKESLIVDLYDSELQWIQCHVSEIPNRVGNKEYLFYCELGLDKFWKNPMGYLHVLKQPISQFFRHIIAVKNGHFEEADYRRFPYLETSKKTRNALIESVV